MPSMTYEEAVAEAREFGNQHMREHGRTQWNDEDWRVAVDRFHWLWVNMVESTGGEE